MKKGFTLIELLVVIAIFGIVFSAISALFFKMPGMNYKISHDGRIYYAESYTKENYGQCIYLSEQETRICGDYVIKKLNVEEYY